MPLPAKSSANWQLNKMFNKMINDMNKDNQSNAEKGSKNQFQPMTKTASRWSNEGRCYLLQAEKTQAQKHYKAARRCFVNAQDLEPGNPIHWYNGALSRRLRGSATSDYSGLRTASSQQADTGTALGGGSYTQW